MTMYLWLIPNDYPDSCYGRYDHHNSPDYLSFRKGIKLEAENFLVTSYETPVNQSPMIRCEAEMAQVRKYDCLESSASAPLVNERVQNLLLAVAPDEVQFIPARVICSDGELEGYSILNITKTIHAIDYENSEYHYIPIEGFVPMLSFDMTVYKPGCLGDLHFARDIEESGYILVNDSIKQLFEEEKVTGVNLITPEQFYKNLNDYFRGGWRDG